MDNLTHSLVGLAAAKAGLERLSPRVTALCVLAANAPDSDIVVLIFRDRWAFLQHHRGISHSIIGTLGLALLVPLLFYAGDLLFSRLRQRPSQTQLKGLLLASLIVTITHPLLDWTNNYGIRFLLPWRATWFYGDLVFVIDPFIWLILGGACFLLTSKTTLQKFCWGLLGLVLSLLVVVGPRNGGLSDPGFVRAVWLTAMGLFVVLFVMRTGERLGARIALVSFAVLALYWTSLAFAHGRAVKQADEQAAQLATRNGESISRLAAMPTLADPLRWDCVFETDRATYKFRLTIGDPEQPAKVLRYPNPATLTSPPVIEAEQDERAKVLLGFARFPVMQLSDPNCTTRTLVQMADLRYTEPGTSRGTFALEVPVDCSDVGLSK
jgi:inner membrane protein